MCRLAAYLGPTIALGRFLLEPDHNLIQQARQPRELTYTTVNADGFGVGWYDDEQRCGRYVNALPIWSDPNLVSLGRSLRSHLWFASVRSATTGHGLGYANTQPFESRGMLYMHNGFVREFAGGLRPRLHRYLDAQVQAEIHGDTDSEFIWALLRHHLAQDPAAGLETAMGETFEGLSRWLDETPAMLNLVVSDGVRIYAARHAVNAACPSLYYTTDDDQFPGAQLVASERLTASDYWQAVPEHCILILDPQQPPERMPL